MNSLHVHDRSKVYEEPTPEVDHVRVTRIKFRRGEGCCDQSPVRMVTAWFDPDGALIHEDDPVPNL